MTQPYPQHPQAYPQAPQAPAWPAPPVASPPAGDPFATPVKVPSVSFDKDAAGNRLNAPVTYVLGITKAPEMVQSRDIKTGDPEFWTDAQGRPTDPKMKIVIGCHVHDGPMLVGQEAGLWCKKTLNTEGSLAKAIIDAKAADGGAPIAPGDRLTVQWYASERATAAGMSDRKIYRAKLERGVYPVAQPAQPDPFGAPAPAPQQYAAPAPAPQQYAAPAPAPQPIQPPPASPWADDAPPF